MQILLNCTQEPFLFLFYDSVSLPLEWRCLLSLASAYLRDLCYPILHMGTIGRCSLRSIERGVFFVPFARTSTRQARAFSVWSGHWASIGTAIAPQGSL